MGVQTLAGVGRSSTHNVLKEAFNAISAQQKTSELDKLIAFKHFPQPVFLIDREMKILEANEQGRLAIEKQWVSVSRDQLHFNNKENDRYVREAIDQLYSAKNPDLSTRFVLRSLDMICRSYTLSSPSADSQELVLTIQSDLNCSTNKLQSIAQVFSLTSSETNIVKMMVTGLKPKEIAYEAGISLNTVRSHLRTLYAKMQVRSYNDALTQAIRLLT